MIEDALENLDNIEEDAHDHGDMPPTDDVVATASRILLWAEGECPHLTYDAYCYKDNTVAIETFGARGYGLLVLVEPNGGLLCIVHSGKNSEMERYDTWDALPNKLLTDGLQLVYDSLQTEVEV